MKFIWSVKPESYNINKTIFTIIWAITSSVLIFFAITQHNALIVILFVLICLIAYFEFQKNPRKVSIQITNKGIKINNEMYDYSELKSFWITYDPKHKKELSIRTTNFFMPYITFPIGKQNPLRLRKFLLKYIPEKQH